MNISIVIPIYNVEQYLDRCISSIINQTYKDLEIILVDDGSPDNSLSICEKYAHEDSRIVILNKKNGGLSDARNAGMRIATGDYLLFVDSDDYIELDTCERFSRIISQYPVDIVTGNAKVITGETESLLAHSDFGSNTPVSAEDYLKHELKRETMHMAAWLNLYRLDFLKENALEFEVGLLHEDEEFTPRVFLKAKEVMHVNDPFYNYIIRANSISQKKDMSVNATHLYGTLYRLEQLYETVADEELKNCLKNSLTTKYLNMYQILKDTKSDNKTTYDKEFVLRNSFSRKNQIKAKLFSPILDFDIEPGFTNILLLILLISAI